MVKVDQSVGIVEVSVRIMKTGLDIEPGVDYLRWSHQNKIYLCLYPFARTCATVKPMQGCPSASSWYKPLLALLHI